MSIRGGVLESSTVCTHLVETAVIHGGSRPQRGSKRTAGDGWSIQPTEGSMCIYESDDLRPKRKIARFAMAKHGRLHEERRQRFPGDGPRRSEEVERQEHRESEGSRGTLMERQRIPSMSVLPRESTPEAVWRGVRQESVIVERRIVGIRPVEEYCHTADIGCEDGSGAMVRPSV